MHQTCAGPPASVPASCCVTQQQLTGCWQERIALHPALGHTDRIRRHSHHTLVLTQARRPHARKASSWCHWRLSRSQPDTQHSTTTHTLPVASQLVLQALMLSLSEWKRFSFCKHDTNHLALAEIPAGCACRRDLKGTTGRAGLKRTTCSRKHATAGVIPLQLQADSTSYSALHSCETSAVVLTFMEGAWGALIAVQPSRSWSTAAALLRAGRPGLASCHVLGTLFASWPGLILRATRAAGAQRTGVSSPV